MSDVARAVIRLMDRPSIWCLPSIEEIQHTLRRVSEAEIRSIPGTSDVVKASVRLFVDSLTHRGRVESQWDAWLRAWLNSRWTTYLRERKKAVTLVLLSHRRPLCVMRSLLCTPILKEPHKDEDKDEAGRARKKHGLFGC